MSSQRTLVGSAATILVVTLVLALLAACGTVSPTQSPSGASSPAPSSSSAASPAAKASSASPQSSAASPSAKPASAEEQAYQKALQNWQKVVETARTEGTAQLLSPVDLDVNRRHQDAFNKLDPKIQVSIARHDQTVIEKVNAEQSTKQYGTSLLVTGSPVTRVLASQGHGVLLDDLPALLEPGVKWIASPLLDKPRETITYAVSQYVILYNTNLVPAGQEPKVWKDLADPKWKDKMVFWDPRLSTSGMITLATLYSNPSFGPDFVRSLVNNMRVVSDNVEAARMVARGEMALTLTSHANYLALKDAPIKETTLEDGAIGASVQALVLKNVPQINVAKVYVNWLLSKEGQRVISQDFATFRQDVDAIDKGAQIRGKLLPNFPSDFDFEMKTMRESQKVFGKWLDDLGK